MDHFKAFNIRIIFQEKKNTHLPSNLHIDFATNDTDVFYLVCSNNELYFTNKTIIAYGLLKSEVSCKPESSP